MTDKRNRGRK